MQRLARWHVWLGWLVGLPIVLWIATGLFMVAKPIEEVRGEHLRIESPPEALILPDSYLANEEAQLKEMRVIMQDGRAVSILTFLDGRTSRVDLKTGAKISPMTAADARNLVEREIVGVEEIKRVTFFEANEVPFDFRRPKPVWQVALADGTHVYVGRDSGEIEAVRTRWWRWFDLAWGLHIMDLETRENTSHPILIGFAALSLIGTLLGCILMFRRRIARKRTRG